MHVTFSLYAFQIARHSLIYSICAMKRKLFVYLLATRWTIRCCCCCCCVAAEVCCVNLSQRVVPLVALWPLSSVLCPFCFKWFNATCRMPHAARSMPHADVGSFCAYLWACHPVNIDSARWSFGKFTHKYALLTVLLPIHYQFCVSESLGRSKISKEIFYLKVDFYIRSSRVNCCYSCASLMLSSEGI